MATNNQGIFKISINHYRNLENKYKDFLLQYYFIDGELNYNFDLISTFVFDADDIFKYSQETINELKAIKQCIKFEIESNKVVYEEMLSKSINIQKEILGKYKDVYNIIITDCVSDADLRTLEKLTITKFI